MSRTIYFLTCEKYFRELKKFLDWMPEDIYVRPSALTDILIDYLINGEVNSALFEQLRLVVDTSSFEAYDYFRDAFEVAFLAIISPLKETMMEKYLHLFKDNHILEQVILQPNTCTIAIRLRTDEIKHSVQKLSHSINTTGNYRRYHRGN